MVIIWVVMVSAIKADALKLPWTWNELRYMIREERYGDFCRSNKVLVGPNGRKTGNYNMFKQVTPHEGQGHPGLGPSEPFPSRYIISGQISLGASLPAITYGIIMSPPVGVIYIFPQLTPRHLHQILFILICGSCFIELFYVTQLED